MARRAIDYPITSKTSRAKLEIRDKPYYRQLAPRVTLGYVRRSSGPGSWVRRENLGPGRFLTRVIATADDLALPDGKHVLSYEQAVKAAGAPRAKPTERLTVKTALEAYLTALAARSKHAKDARQRCEKHIYPTLGSKRVDALTRTDVETWRNALVVDRDDDPDTKRRSQDSANRLLTILKAGLNHAFSEETNGIASDKAWRSVKAFRDTTGTREYHFTPEETIRLIDSARKLDETGTFANLCEAGFLTGARYGELAALDVRHFDARQGSLQVPSGKTGSRIVSLTAESIAFFAPLAMDRPGTEPLLPRWDGERWGKSHQHRPMKDALKDAKLPLKASFYALRHSHISRAIEAGMPLTLIAENSGTSVRMIEQTYGKFIKKTRQELIEKTSPKLRVIDGGNVSKISGRKARARG